MTVTAAPPEAAPEPAPAGTEGAPRPPWYRSSWLRDRAVPVAIDATIVVVATLVPLAIVFRFWDGGFRVPYSYWGDANAYGGFIQNVIDTGWYQNGDRVGAPFGQEMYDFALGGDNFNWLVVKAMTLFSGNWVLVANGFYLLTFPATALTAFFSLRWMGTGRVTAVVAAVLYAFAPYHFLRNTGHLMYSAYAIVPISVVLAVRAGRGQSPFWELRRFGRRRWPVALGWVVAAALVGSCGSYFAVFGMLMIATAGCVGGLARRHRAPILAAGATIVVVALTLGANLAQSILYARTNGDNPQVADRAIDNVDFYGLRVAQMVSPIPDHRIGPLRDLSNRLLEGPYNSEVSMFLGAVATLGLVAMLVWLLMRVFGTGSRPASDDVQRDDDDVRPLLAILTIVSIIVGTIGGLSWFIALAGLEEIRAWNRISIVIAFLALAWLALTIDRLRSRWRLGTAGRLVAVAIGVAAIAVGVADQTGRTLNPDWRVTDDAFHADRAYFGAIEQRLPEGASVFQLPYVPYPESGPFVDLIDYDPLRPYLSTRDLRWSYGAMKGRPEADWQEALAKQPAGPLVEQVVAGGFSGILVDTFGYADRAPELLADLREVTGDRGFTSPDGRWVFFDLGDATVEYERTTSPEERAATRAATLVTVRAGIEGCYDLEREAATGSPFRWCPAGGRLTFDRREEVRPFMVEVEMEAAPGSEITFDLPDGPSTARTDATGTARASFVLDIGDGQTVIPFTSDAPRVDAPADSRTLHLRVFDAVVTAETPR